MLNCTLATVDIFNSLSLRLLKIFSTRGNQTGEILELARQGYGVGPSHFEKLEPSWRCTHASRAPAIQQKNVQLDQRF